jgi:hypothetical protein
VQLLEYKDVLQRDARCVQFKNNFKLFMHGLSMTDIKLFAAAKRFVKFTCISVIYADFSDSVTTRAPNGHMLS